MDKHEYNDILQLAIDEKGTEFHLRLLQEEAAELIASINHFIRGRIDKDKVLEEMADVAIVADAMRMIFNDEVGYRDLIFSKMERLHKRMKFKDG